MRYSKLFSKASKDVPRDADTINHKLLTQAGFVDQLMAGVYTYLPLGLRVLKKIEQIVREEMNSIGGQEILMPVLHPKANWETTGGWDSIDVLFKIKSRTEKEYALGQSEEEVVTPLAAKFIHSYKDLPLALYQIHWKFRDELRAKSGILRGREFYMKDMYSLHENQEDFQRFYSIVKGAYIRLYKKLGLVAKATEASGGSFSKKISYEFMVLTNAGEDIIYYCTACDFCVNIEIAKVKADDMCPSCKNAKLKEGKASEVGNVFDLGQKYTKDFGMTFMDRNGEQQYPIMGCYGIGISRVMGVIVEKNNDERGIVWPEAVAPYQCHLIHLEGVRSAAFEVSKWADEVYQKLLSAGMEVLFDDREDVGAGEKFGDADLIGIPVRLVVSEKTGKQIEWKERKSNQAEIISIDEVLNRLARMEARLAV